MAIRMAEKGHDLLLVARRGHRLEEISSDLKEKYNVNVNYFVTDLKDKSAPQEIYDYVKSSNLDISILMLNAGYQICLLYTSPSPRDS